MHLLWKTWADDRNAPQMNGRKITIVCEGKAFQYTSPDGIHTESQ